MEIAYTESTVRSPKHGIRQSCLGRKKSIDMSVTLTQYLGLTGVPIQSLGPPSAMEPNAPADDTLQGKTSSREETLHGNQEKGREEEKETLTVLRGRYLAQALAVPTEASPEKHLPRGFLAFCAKADTNKKSSGARRTSRGDNSSSTTTSFSVQDIAIPSSARDLLHSLHHQIAGSSLAEAGLGMTISLLIGRLHHSKISPRGSANHQGLLAPFVEERPFRAFPEQAKRAEGAALERKQSQRL
jgi:hypothetical protein